MGVMYLVFSEDWEERRYFRTEDLCVQNKSDASWQENISEWTTKIDEISADVDPEEQNDQEQTTIGWHSPL